MMIDILEIRERLNQMPFREGRRQVFIGRISDAVPQPESDDEDDSEATRDTPEVQSYLRQLDATLARQDLTLVRGEEDPDSLYVEQKLRRQSNVDLSWMSEGVAWTSRITTVSLEMVIPGLIGYWLDGRFGTGFVLSLVGFALGLILGVWHLVQMSKAKKASDV
jgi:hypothetical protein